MSFDRAVVLRTVVAVVTIAALCVGAAFALRPGDDVTPDGFEAGFLAACGRSGGGEQACRCAFDRWTATVPASDRIALDADLADGAALSAELSAALADC